MAQHEKQAQGLPQVKPTTIREVSRHPATYAMIVIASAFASVLTVLMTATSKTTDTCAEEKRELQEQLKQERQAKNDLINAVLLKQGVIDKLPEAVDSLTK